MSIVAIRLDRSRIKMPLGVEVGLGPGNIVLDGDRAPLKRGTALTFRPMFIVAKRLDKSRCHLVRRLGLGPGNIVLDANPAAPLRGTAPSPNLRSISVVAKRLDGSR